MFKFNVLMIIIPCCLALFGCSNISSLTKVHRIQIVQGNIFTQKDLDKLRPRMTKRQVNYIMGTPLILDPFDSDIWGYYYSIEAQGIAPKKVQITLSFKDNVLVDVEGDLQPEAFQ